MKATWLWTLLLIFHGMSVLSAERKLSAPDFPPKDWTIWISIQLSTDLLKPFLEKKPGKDEFLHAQPIHFWIDSKGGLKGPRQHTVLTGKLPGNNAANHEMVLGAGAITYLPIVDQKLVYENALETITKFTFTGDLKHHAFDASGIDVELRLEINGRAASARFEKIQPADGLPGPVVQALASLRRNLPAEYTRLFDFLRVPKWDKLPENEAGKHARCAVHHEWMAVDEVPISYGFPSSREKYWKAAQELFPNAYNYLGGGCTVTPASPKSAKTLYCRQCRSAEQAWLKDNEPAPRK